MLLYELRAGGGIIFCLVLADPSRFEELMNVAEDSLRRAQAPSFALNLDEELHYFHKKMGSE